MKLLKRMISVFLSAVIAFGCLGGLTVNAAAAGKITRRTVYGKNGEAIITLTPSEEENYITYTVDGTAPKSDSEKYEGELKVYNETFFRVAEFTPERKRISGIKFTVKPRVTGVSFEVEESEGNSKVKLSSKTSRAAIYYTTDGSTPTTQSNRYSEPFEIECDTIIKAIAVKKGFKNSACTTKKVSVSSAQEVKKTDNSSQPDNDEKTLKKINYKTTFLDEQGRTRVTFLPQKSTNKIYYTTDGSKPTQKSKLYKKYIYFTEADNLRAVEYNAKGEQVGALNIKVPLKCAPVTFTCVDIAPFTYTIEMTTKTEGADIYYTFNGEIPTVEYGVKYTGPITLGSEATVTAAAFKTDYKKSVVSSEKVSLVPTKFHGFDFSDPAFKEGADLVNAYRKLNGLKPLVLDEKLTEIACIRAKEISIDFNINRPSGLNVTSLFSDFELVTDANYQYIDARYETSTEFIEVAAKQFKDIPFCNTAIDYDSMGIGYYRSGKSIHWVLILVRMR